MSTWEFTSCLRMPRPPSSTMSTGAKGTAGNFVFKYSSVNGAGYLGTVYALINSSVVPNGGCYAYYVPGGNAWYLQNDTGKGVA